MSGDFRDWADITLWPTASRQNWQPYRSGDKAVPAASYGTVQGACT
jgi:hypothetical protein